MSIQKKAPFIVLFTAVCGVLFVHLDKAVPLYFAIRHICDNGGNVTVFDDSEHREVPVNFWSVSNLCIPGTQRFSVLVSLGPLGTDLDAMETLSTCKHVDEIEIVGPLNPGSDLHGIGCLRSVNTLRLINVTLSPDSMRECGDLENLERLELMGERIVDEDVQYVPKNKGLREVYLGGTAITSIGVDQLSARISPANITIINACP